MYTHRSVKAVEYMVHILKFFLELQWDWYFIILLFFSFYHSTFHIKFCYFIIHSLSPLDQWCSGCHLPYLITLHSPNFVSFKLFFFTFFLSFLLSIILSHPACFLLYFSPDYIAVVLRRLFPTHFRTYISTTLINASSLFPSISYFLHSLSNFPMNAFTLQFFLSILLLSSQMRSY